MPANWDPNQHIDSETGRIEWPTGPMTDIDPDYEPRWVEAWVVQGGGIGPGQVWAGPSQSSAQSSWTGFQSGRWTAPEAGWRNGRFAPGPAVGISLLALRDDDGHYQYDWWFDVVTLRD